jgi:hypothetical protein
MRIMNKKSWWMTTVANVLALCLTASAGATIIELSGDPGSQYWADQANAIAAKVRNGNADSSQPWESAIGVIDIATAGERYAETNIPWSYGSPYNFTFTYVVATGTATLIVSQGEHFLYR